MRLRFLKLAAVVAVAGLTLAACPFGGDGSIETVARFQDVGDLAPTAPVMMADIRVGQVEDIRLDGDEALVTMALDPEARVPRDVTARIRRTSVLGERIVDLAVPPDLPTDAPLLEDGAEIRNTETRADLEDLVVEGTDVLAPIAASEIATLVDEGARGFGGRGRQLGTLLRNFRTIVRAYSGRTDTIRSVIRSMDRFNSTLASRARAHARSVANSARGIGMLADETDRLERAIRSLARLSVGGRGILEAHSDEMRRFFRQARIILGVLQSERDSILRLLQWAPFHNRNTQLVEYQDFNQIYQDFVICGMNDDPEDPARRCPEEDS